MFIFNTWNRSVMYLDLVGMALFCSKLSHLLVTHISQLSTGLSLGWSTYYSAIERGREAYVKRSSFHWFTPQWLQQSDVCQSKTDVRSFIWASHGRLKPKYLGHICCFPLDIKRELDQKWNNYHINWLLICLHPQYGFTPAPECYPPTF